MNISEIIKSSINYPRKNWISVILLGILLVITSLPLALSQMNISDLYIFIMSIVGVIIWFIVAGYNIDVIKSGINRDYTVPGFSLAKQFINGIKLTLISIVYMIIPTLITIVLLFFVGLVALDKNILANTANLTSTATVPILAILLIALILFILFGLFLTIGECRFAKTGSMGEAVNFKAVFNDLNNIGVLNLIGLIIVIFFLVLIFAIGISLVGVILSLLGAVGLILYFIIAYLLFVPYFTIFANRCIGLIYSNIV